MKSHVSSLPAECAIALRRPEINRTFSASTFTGGSLLFHTSLLVDLDIPLMLRVLKTPFEKISDKAIATVAERVTTVHREL